MKELISLITTKTSSFFGLEDKIIDIFLQSKIFDYQVMR